MLLCRKMRIGVRLLLHLVQRIILSLSAEKLILGPNLESGSINGGNTQTVVCLTTNVITIGPNSFRKSSLTSIFISS